MKVCVYAISKNESLHVTRFCESAKDADHIVIGDTGSTDNTVDLAKQCGAVVHQIHIEPWRFDHARTTVLALVPPDIDVCIALDLDEVLTSGWRKIIDHVWVRNVTNVLRYRYNWDNGRTMLCCRIHSRNGWIWKNACHEVIYPDTRTLARFAETDATLVEHLQDKSKDRTAYLALMKVPLAENPNNSKMRFYYARELIVAEKLVECLRELDFCIATPGNLDKIERSGVWLLKAKVLIKMGGDINTICEAYTFACDIDSGCRRTPLLEFAFYCYSNGRYEQAYQLAKRVLAITHSTFSYVHLEDAIEWKMLPWHIAALSAHSTNRHSEALEYGIKALEFEPNDPSLLNNFQVYSQMYKVN